MTYRTGTGRQGISKWGKAKQTEWKKKNVRYAANIPTELIELAEKKRIESRLHRNELLIMLLENWLKQK